MHYLEQQQIPDTVLIYNPKSGKQNFAQAEIARLGLPAIPFLQFLQSGATLQNEYPKKIVVAGGDGTVFSVARVLASELPSSAVINMLVLPIGSENVAANIAQTIPKYGTPESVAAIIQRFQSGELESKTLKPFQYTTPDGTKDFGFWSIGAGGIALQILDELERRRSIKDPTLRKTMATLGMLMRKNKIRHQAKTGDGMLLEGWDVAYISSLFHFWPKFLDVAQTCTGCGSNLIHKPHDYLLRFGTADQTAVETYCGLLLDFAALRLFGRPATGTLHVEPVVDSIIEITAPGRTISVDSEIVRSQVSGSVKIDRQPQCGLPQINLAFRSPKSTI
jgi:hypothetical protein